MSRSQQTAGFASAVKEAGVEAFNSSRDVKGTSFERDEVDDGTYVATLSSGRTGVDKNKNPYAVFDFTIERGDFKDCTVSKFHSLSEGVNKSGEVYRSKEQAWGSFFIDLKRLAEESTTFDEIEPEDVEEMIVDLTAEGPVIQIGVRNWKTEHASGSNVFINKRIDDDTAPAIGEMEEEDYDPSIGDVYLWKAPRTKKEVECGVASVGDETVELRRLKDMKVFKGISWDDLGDFVRDGIKF